MKRNRARRTGQVIVLAMAAAITVQAVDAAAHPLPPRPAGRPGDWASDDDYPVAALRDNAEGNVGFLLTIGPDGLPTKCEVIQSSGNADLDNTTCIVLLQRARFNPATDANGNPTNGTFRSTIRWRIPRDNPSPVPSSYVEKIEYDVLADGSIANCSLTFSHHLSDAEAKRAQTLRCAMQGPFAPLTASAGKSPKKHVVRTETVAVTDVP
jgi:protein TonB